MNIILKTIRQLHDTTVSRGRLARLNDRMLRDIGVTRPGVEHDARLAR